MTELADRPQLNPLVSELIHGQLRDPLKAQQLKAEIVQRQKAVSRRRRAVWLRVGLIPRPRQQEATAPRTRPRSRPRRRRARRSITRAGDSGPSDQPEPGDGFVVGLGAVPCRRPGRGRR